MNNQIQKASQPLSVAASPGRFEAIDGLRALACIGVILYHCFIDAGRYSFPEINLGFTRLSLPHGISYGYLGVEVFFVLSAFCLAYPYLAKEKPILWKDYLYRRAIRILPPYWVAYLLLVLAGIVIRFTQIGLFYSPITFVSLQFGLKDTINGFFLRSVAYNNVFWTLCLEVRWYFVFPPAVYLMRRIGWLSVFGACCAVSLLYYFGVVHHAYESNRFSAILFGLTTDLPFYLPTFALGLLAAQLAVQSPAFVKDHRFIILVRTCFFVACAFINFFVPFFVYPVHLGRLLFGSTIAFTLLLLGLFDPFVRRLLSRPLLVTIGIASYSIYLIHEPLVRMMYFYTGPLHWSEPIQFLWYQIIMPPLLILIGLGFFRIVEQPLLARQKALKTTPAAEAVRGGVP